eukprot:3056048-Prymnesium_polylepis.1
MCVSDRHAIEGAPHEGAPHDGRGRAAEGLLTLRTGPVALPEPRRRPRYEDASPGPPGRLVDVVRPCFVCCVQ